MRVLMHICLALIATTFVAGCANDHGKYTKEGKSLAAQRLDQIKAMQQYDIAERAFLAGDLDKALPAIDNSITLRDQVAKSHVLRGRILLEQGALEAAMNSFEMAEAIEEENVPAQYYMGIVSERFSRPADALVRYQKAAELDTTNPQYPVAAAEMLIELDRLDEAETYLNERAEAFEHNAGVQQTLGHIAMLKQEPQRAVDMFNEARLLAPDDLAILEDLARAQVVNGQFAEAEYALARLLKAEQNEGRRDLRHMRTRCLIAVDRRVEARTELLELTTSEGGDADIEAWIELGNVCYALKDFANVRQAGTRLIGIAPHRPEGFVFRAMWRKHNGDLEQALADLDQAVERREQDVTPLVLRGMLQEEMGMFDAAEFSYRTALNEDPECIAAGRMLESLDTRRATAAVDPDR